MTPGTVVLLGNLPAEMPSLNRLVPEFGWSLDTASDFDQLRSLLTVRRPVAILLDANGLGLPCKMALDAVREIDSQTPVIVCHRFSDPVDWHELARAGAFHALALPFNLGEVRQSLAFVWAARFRRARNPLVMPRVAAHDALTSDEGPTTAVAARVSAR
jgi:DNA-binding NtrC family response regulator